MTTPATRSPHEIVPWTARDRILLLMVCGIALMLRLLVVWACAGAGLFSDMQEYYDRARHLVEHGEFQPDAFRPPGYPVFLAAIAWLFDERTVIAARVVQAVLGAASVGLTGLLARRFAGPRAGLVAAAILAIYPAWLIYPVYLVAEPLFMFLTLLGIWLWTLGGAWTVMLAGIVLSLAMQTRAVGIATIAGISVTSTIAILGTMRHDARRWRPAASRLVLLIVAFALMLAPWVVRNARLFGEFIPTDTASGWNFILGNNPLATGRLELDHIPMVSQQYWSRATTDVQRSKIGIEAGMAFIRSHPGRSLVLALRKIGYLVGLEGREHAWTYSYHYHGKRSAPVVWAWGVALLASFPLVMIAGLIGMFRPSAVRTPLGAALIATLAFVVLVHVSSFGESRFHLPWIPVLAIFASAIWTTSANERRSTSTRLVCDALLLTLVILWMTQAPDLLDRLVLLARSAGPIRLPY